MSMKMEIIKSTRLINNNDKNISFGKSEKRKTRRIH